MMNLTITVTVGPTRAKVLSALSKSENCSIHEVLERMLEDILVVLDSQIDKLEAEKGNKK